MHIYNQKTMKKQIITPDAVKEMIAETAKFLKTKKEIAKKALQLEGELKSLNENFGTFTNSFGFKSDNDMSNKSKTGFVEPIGPFSNLSELGAEITAELNKTDDTETLDEVAKLRLEVESLKAELAKK